MPVISKKFPSRVHREYMYVASWKEEKTERTLTLPTRINFSMLRGRAPKNGCRETSGKVEAGAFRGVASKLEFLPLVPCMTQVSARILHDWLFSVINNASTSSHSPRCNIFHYCDCS